MYSFYAPYIVALQTHTAPVAPTAALTPQFLQMEVGLQLLNLVQLFVSAIVNCAVFRAVLHPERSRFAYLRLGIAELLVVVLIFLAGIAFFVLMLLVMIPLGFVLGVAMVASHGDPTTLAVILPITVLVVLFVGLFVVLRFAVAAPMIVDDGKFHLFDAWIVTRGHFWSLFAITISLLLIGLLAEIVILILLVAIGLAGVGAIAGGFTCSRDWRPCWRSTWCSPFHFSAR
jgi:hypothetical protein